VTGSRPTDDKASLAKTGSATRLGDNVSPSWGLRSFSAEQDPFPRTSDSHVQGC